VLQAAVYFTMSFWETIAQFAADIWDAAELPFHSFSVELNVYTVFFSACEHLM
jgi:hypothetical protein